MDTKQLKQRILDLAIRGKLVPQDPNDEPASVLLERIRAEKEQLIAQGKLKKSKTKASDKPHYENVPFEIPESWEWVRLDDVAQSNIGLTYSPSEITNDGIPVLRSCNIKNQKLYWEDLVRVNSNILEKQYLNDGDLLICARNGSRHLVGKCALITNIQEPISFGAFMAVCRSQFNRWIYYLLHTTYFDRYLDDSNSTTINQVTQKMLLDFQIPLPPAVEQQRIVAEVEKWFALIDKLEANKEDLRDYIKQVKSKVLDLAIHGKLVQQDPNDEPAIELLKRINPNFKPCDTSHYENLPQGWCTCSFKDAFDITMGSSPDGSTLNHGNDGIEFHQGKINFTEKYLAPSNIYTNSPNKFGEAFSILLCVRAPVGIVNITQRKICIGRGLCTLLPKKDIDLMFAFYAMQTYQDIFEAKATGTTFKAISGSTIRDEMFLLPPYTEQIRIRKKLDELWSIIDSIRAEL